MYNICKRINSALFCAALLLTLLLSSVAYGATSADDLSAGCSITQAGSKGDVALLRDGSEATKVWFENGGTITISSPEAISSLYLVWDYTPEKWQLETTEGQVTCGEIRYLHQYQPLATGQTTLEISFEGIAVLSELRLFGEGTPPPEVQDWSVPLDKADLLLLPTHADDELLYFGGAMPTYTAQGKSVQVAYMVDHRYETHRRHELLNGLWLSGVRNYPIIPSFVDKYSPSLEHASTIYDPAEILAYQVELIRRFQPEVIVGHDINGEYGHGAHRLNSATLQKAVVEAADETLHPTSLAQYGAWNTKKTYLHLYPERSLTMNWDVPLPMFNGATSYEVAVAGYSKHASQGKYFKMEPSGPYDCRKFGLFRSTVGDDVAQNDFFENIL